MNTDVIPFRRCSFRCATAVCPGVSSADGCDCRPRFSWLCLRVVVGSEVVLEDALGHFTHEDRAPAVTAQTVYDLASLTKVVATTAAAMLLCERGLLDLDLPVGELLPGFVVGRKTGDLARDVTIRHLLAHNSGLPGYVEFFRAVSTPAALFRGLP